MARLPTKLARGKEGREKKNKTRPSSRTFSGIKKIEEEKRGGEKTKTKTRAVELNERLMFGTEVFTGGRPEGRPAAVSPLRKVKGAADEELLVLDFCWIK